MNGARIDGALQFPAFLLVWSAGLLFFVGGFYRADAALISTSPSAFSALASIPSLTESRDFSRDLNTALGSSDVIARGWQPPDVASEIKEVAFVDHSADSPPSITDAAIDVKPQVNVEVLEASSAPSQAEATDKSGMIEKPVVPEVGLATPGVVRKVPTTGVRNAHPQLAGAQHGTANMIKRPVAKRIDRVDSRIVQLRSEAREALAQGDSVSAYRLLMKNLPGASEDIDYLALLAVAALDLQRPEEALLIYEKLIKLSRTDSRWWMGLAVCQENLGVDASALYEEVVRLTQEGSSLQGLALDRLDSARNLS